MVALSLLPHRSEDFAASLHATYSLGLVTSVAALLTSELSFMSPCSGVSSRKAFQSGVIHPHGCESRAASNIVP